MRRHCGVLTLTTTLLVVCAPSGAKTAVSVPVADVANTLVYRRGSKLTRCKSGITLTFQPPRIWMEWSSETFVSSGARRSAKSLYPHSVEPLKNSWRWSHQPPRFPKFV